MKIFTQFYSRIFLLILSTSSYHRIYSTSAQSSHQKTRVAYGIKSQPPPLVKNCCFFCAADFFCFAFLFSPFWQRSVRIHPISKIKIWDKSSLAVSYLQFFSQEIGLNVKFRLKV